MSISALAGLFSPGRQPHPDVYEVLADLADEFLGYDFDGPAEPCLPAPPEALPGTPAKMAVLSDRALSRPPQELWHPGDPLGPVGPRRWAGPRGE